MFLLLHFKSNIPNGWYYRNQKEKVYETTGNIEVQKVYDYGQTDYYKESMQNAGFFLLGRGINKEIPFIRIEIHQQEKYACQEYIQAE